MNILNMEKYINKNEYDDKYHHYYQINDYITFTNYKLPTKEKLEKLLHDLRSDLKNSEKYEIYVTGRFNSNQYKGTRDIDLILTCKCKTTINYEEIYDILYFLKIIGLEKYELLIDPIYSEIVISENITPENITNMNTHDISNFIKNKKAREGEQITIFKKVIKKSVNDKSSQELNDDIIKKKISINNKVLYIFDYNLLSLDKSIIKKKNYIINGCIYYGREKIF